MGVGAERPTSRGLRILAVGRSGGVWIRQGCRRIDRVPRCRSSADGYARVAPSDGFCKGARRLARRWGGAKRPRLATSEASHSPCRADSSCPAPWRPRGYECAGTEPTCARAQSVRRIDRTGAAQRAAAVGPSVPPGECPPTQFSADCRSTTRRASGKWGAGRYDASGGTGGRGEPHDTVGTGSGGSASWAGIAGGCARAQLSGEPRKRCTRWKSVWALGDAARIRWSRI